MEQIKITKIINASHKETFEAINDIGGVHLWHPNVGTSELLTENNGGLGSARICYFYTGEQFEEHVVGFADQEYIAIEVRSGFPSLMKSNKSYLRVSKLSETQTKVTMEFNFEVAFGLIGKLMAKMMVIPRFTKLGNRVLQGLKTHMETGEYIGRGGHVLGKEYTFEKDMDRLEDLPVQLVAN